MRKNPEQKMAENLDVHMCTQKREMYPPATVFRQCHTMPGMLPRRVDRGDLRPYLSLTVSRKTWPFRQDSEANRP